MRGDYALFFGLWLQKPLQIAAVTPSSQRFACVMADLVDLRRPGPVLELGAGTGSLTHGLLRAGCPAERLIAMEREPRLAAALRRRFPGIRTIVGDATALPEHLERLGIDRLCAVVSSLPIKWFSLAAQRQVVEPCLGPARTGRAIPANDQCVFFADREATAGDRRPPGGSGLAQPAAVADLGLFNVFRYRAGDRMNDLLPNTLSHPASHHYRTIWLSATSISARAAARPST